MKTLKNALKYTLTFLYIALGVLSAGCLLMMCYTMVGFLLYDLPKDKIVNWLAGFVLFAGAGGMFLMLKTAIFNDENN